MTSEQASHVLAIDQGTTSTRAMVFDRSGRVVAVDQREHRQILPRAGWVEHDATEIWANTRAVVGGALAAANLNATSIVAVGITNQRETTVVWDRSTGEPVHHAIVWQDTRTQALCDELAGDEGPERFKARTGLPLATYFAGPKVRWILDHVEGARERADAGELLFGTVDTWLLWNLTGGAEHDGVHVTDVTNASRTLMMDIRTLDWADDVVEAMGVPRSMLPEIRSSSEEYGVCHPGILIGVPVAGILGDQHAATFGQACLDVGSAKNTYGTGNFMLLNTGDEIIESRHGLLTTLCYRLGEQPPVYALEGSIAVTGSLVQWLRDNLGLIDSAAEVERLAATVEDNGGAYFVPAFSGLFAPHWRSDARGALVGLTRFVNKGHIARAALEATAFQTREVLDAMEADSGVRLTELKVDGGMVVNETLMQFQADLLGVDVVRPRISETTALGAAYAAGLAVGYWASTDEIRDNWAEDRRWSPSLDPAERERLYRTWKKAVERTLDWVDDDTR
ncbi:glycerol kinase GlpK [Terracoccus luteus]|jgi:glycerol kinase|uniref:Glycerol kinase n=1 Tax=Terracoccus luteus TaxID=53356 RepID=A0A495Y2S8_9MICO|nr:glycerol kinase GlpK [Terracoccus luteus]MBB2986490.1 glycerol kinase [Terracoccus luteus]MCP2171921.1 glycerol kinase [Terracoccus luteus]RKT79253.1 glycerol kinase [Terracoccus luteus]